MCPKLADENQEKSEKFSQVATFWTVFAVFLSSL
jgi:hypothetical protein